MAVDEKLQGIMKDLEDGVKAVFDSDNYTNWLNTMSKFHNYSVNNTILIMSQKPEATRVASFSSWEKNFNRHVIKGEKGIKIIAPAPYKMMVDKPMFDKSTKEPILNERGEQLTEKKEVTIPAFKVVTVFDESQTYGDKIPQLGVDELTSKVDFAENMQDIIGKISPVPIEFGNINGSAKGYFSVTENKIMIKEGMSDSQTIKTMIHEISHAMLHSEDQMKKDKEAGIEKNSKTKEVEAESVAFVVCKHFGIDTSDYSFGYIAGWSDGKDMDELKGSMQTIKDTSSEIINRIEGHLRGLQLVNDKEVKVDEVVTNKEPIKETVKEIKNDPKKEKVKGSVKEKLKKNKERVNKASKDKKDKPLAKEESKCIKD